GTSGLLLSQLTQKCAGAGRRHFLARLSGPGETIDEVASGGWKEDVAGVFPFPATAHHQIPD
ncbi:hypothetical protein NRY67_01745, partial [Acidithiobacillus ferrooxidans]|uniref:hypothetical protein n=1 Tax=Acidithiobacillus ferrooxidans TaxID=920 RepID=UPI0021471F09